MIEKVQFSKDTQSILDTIKVMRHQEEGFYKNVDYFNNLTPTTTDKLLDQNFVNEECRELIADWFYQVIDFMGLNRITGNIAMSYLDSFVSKSEDALYDRIDYQLSAMVCLELAAKIHEPHKICLKLIFELSRGICCISELKQKEKQVLSALGWRMCHPTASCFATYYLDLLPKGLSLKLKDQIKVIAMDQIEKSVRDYAFLSFRPSEIALASILNAMDIIQYSCSTHSFYESILLINELVPTDSMINDIRRKLGNPMEAPFLSLDEIPDLKTYIGTIVEYEPVSPICISRN